MEDSAAASAVNDVEIHISPTLNKFPSEFRQNYEQNNEKESSSDLEENSRNRTTSLKISKRFMESVEGFSLVLAHEKSKNELKKA